MGEFGGILIVLLFILAGIFIVMMKTQFNKRAVVKPFDQADYIERVKIKLTPSQIKSLGDAVMNRTQFVDMYEVGSERMLQFQIVEKVEPKAKK